MSKNVDIEMSEKKSEGNSRKLLWFRKGLRLHDNPALVAACSQTTELFPVYIINQAQQQPCGVNRWRFILESLKDLDNNLRKLGSRLIVLNGDPEVVLPELC